MESQKTQQRTPPPMAETTMFRMKPLLGGSLMLRDNDSQVAEAMAMVRALNKMIKAETPESVRIA